MKKFKRVLSPIIVAIMLMSILPLRLFAAWDGETLTKPSDKDGVYLISDENELAWFASEVNSGNNDISAVLTDNIDLGETSWLQIGSGSAFSGTFDGNHKTVDYSINDSSAIYRGLFNTVSEEGTVKNLTVSGTLTISKARNYHGAIAGMNKGTISGCTSDVDILSSPPSIRVTYVGGIAGINTGLIESCVNNGNVTVTSYAAGIAGENRGGSIKSCVNNGAVTASNTAGYAGGIAAAVTANSSDNKMTIESCKNCGTVTGGTGDYGYAAGIIAQENVASSYNQYTSRPELTITGCENNGEISGGNVSDIIAKQSSNCDTTITEKETPTAPEPTPEDKQSVENVIEGFKWFKLNPIFGKDTNVLDIMNEKLHSLSESEGITISLKSTDDTSYIAENGDITYFFENPDLSLGMWFKSVPLVFTFSKNGYEYDYKINATIHWDADRVKAYLEENILSDVTMESILGQNTSADEVTSDLTLCKVVNDKKWTLVSWESSDTSVISISDKNQNTADTLFEPYIGVVKRASEDKTVTLTASFDFRRTTYNEAPIILKKTFTVTVKAFSFGVKEEMQKLLNENYTVDKLLVFGTENIIDAGNVAYDIQLPIPRATGIENYSDYTFSVTSGDKDTVEINYYRALVFRPLPEEKPKEVTLTVTMRSKEYDISVSKDIKITVMPLTQEEIDREIALMEKVKAAYFDGINNGANEDAAHIVNNLSAFCEARYGSDGESIEWIYTNAQANGSGIIPVSIDESRPSEYWDRFFTTDSSVISYKNLIVTRSENDKKVTVSSCLSSEKFERYAEKYPDNEDFGKLYRQYVSAELTVIGLNDKPDDSGDTDNNKSCKLCIIIEKLIEFFKTIKQLLINLFK